MIMRLIVCLLVWLSMATAGIGAASGGILGGKDGALSGASAAVVAETLADIMRPQVEAALTEIAHNADSHDDYHTQAEEYLGTQHNLILLTSVAITASLGGDVDTATCAADNALKNNNLNLLRVLLKTVWQATKNTVTKGAVKSVSKPVNVEKLADKVATKLGGVKTPAKGDGYIIRVPNGKKDIVVRIMKNGGERSKPYYRVGVDSKGSVTKAGQFESKFPELTHFDIKPESLNDIINLVNKITKG